MKAQIFATIIFLESLSIFTCNFIIKSDDFTDGSRLQKRFTPLGQDVKYLY